jgi:hypothetical protein
MCAVCSPYSLLVFARPIAAATGIKMLAEPLAELMAKMLAKTLAEPAAELPLEYELAGLLTPNQVGNRC